VAEVDEREWQWRGSDSLDGMCVLQWRRCGESFRDNEC
jgi:hypothetical protein